MAKTTELPELPQGIVVRGAVEPGYERVLTAEAIAFVAELERKFGPERRRLLARRFGVARGQFARPHRDEEPEHVLCIFSRNILYYARKYD